MSSGPIPLIALKAAILVLSFCGLAYAQMESGSIAGIITDASGTVIASAALRLVDIDRNTTIETKSGPAGLYRFESVRPGHYRMQVQHDDFKVANITGITVNTQDSLEENVQLEVGSLVESTTLVIETPKANNANAPGGAVIDRDLVVHLPLNGRSLQALFTLIPGTNLISASNSSQQFEYLSVNGQRDQANAFFIDGVSANVAVQSAFSGRAYGSAAGNLSPINAVGGTQSMVSADELDEFRVQTSTYSAQYGGNPGGKFMLTTRSGSDVLHGSAYLFFNHEALDAIDSTHNPRGYRFSAVRQWQPGGVIGGPIWVPHLYDGRGRTFFFASFETLSFAHQSNRDYAIPGPELLDQMHTASPNLYMALPFFRLDLSGPMSTPALPSLRNGFVQLSDSWAPNNWTYSGAVRLDHDFSRTVRAFMRYSGSPSVSHIQGPLPYAADLTSTHYGSLTGGVTWRLRPSLVDDIRVNYSSGRSLATYGPDGRGPGLSTYAPRLQDPNSYLIFFSVGSGADSQIFQQGRSSTELRQWQVNDVASLSRGAHSVKFGADIRWLTPIVNHFRDEAAYYFFTGVSNQPDFTKSPNVAIAQMVHSIGAQPVLKNYAFFVDDAWKIAPRLAINAGLRWELTGGLGSTATASGYPAGFRAGYINIAPRVGVTYSINDRVGRETLLRLGVGWFYDSTNGSILGASHDSPFAVSVEYSHVPFPLTEEQLNSVAPAQPGNNLDSGPLVPKTYSWSVAFEQALGPSQKVVATYVGNQSRHLAPGGAYASGRIPTVSQQLFSDSAANYEALQVQFQRRLSRGLQVIAAYTWAHSLDDALVYQGGTQPYAVSYGNSDADRRHVVRLGTTYVLPRIGGRQFIRVPLSGWTAAVNIAIQSGSPLSVTDGTNLSVLSNGELMLPLAERDRTVSAWIRNAAVPGRWQLNPAAFHQAGPGIIGSGGRNGFNEFTVGQADIALTREFSLSERGKLQLGAEAFNVTNHPNFSHFINTWTPEAMNSNFGQAQSTVGQSLGSLNALAQIGAPRSMQFVVRFTF